METSRSDVVLEWLNRLDELEPADGILTEEILNAAGPFPVYKPPGDAFDNRHDRVKSSQYHEYLVARSAAIELAKVWLWSPGLRKKEAPLDSVDDQRADKRYWTSLTRWLEKLPDANG